MSRPSGELSNLRDSLSAPFTTTAQAEAVVRDVINELKARPEEESRAVGERAWAQYTTGNSYGAYMTVIRYLRGEPSGGLRRKTRRRHTKKRLTRRRQ